MLIQREQRKRAKEFAEKWAGKGYDYYEIQKKANEIIKQ